MNVILLLGEKKILATEIKSICFTVTKDINEDGLKWKTHVSQSVTSARGHYGYF